MVRRLLILCLACAAVAARLGGQDVPLTAGERPGPAVPAWTWKLQAADDALALGLGRDAAFLYGEVLAAGVPEPLAERVRLRRLSAWLAADDVRAAAAEVLAWTGLRGAAFELRAGLVAFREGRLAAATEALARTDAAALDEHDAAWREFLAAALAESRGDLGAASAGFARAAERAVSPAQRAQFSAAQTQVRLLSGDTGEDLERQLRAQVRDFADSLVGLQYAQQLAVVLARQGRRDEALEFLQAQLRGLPAGEIAARDGFLLLTALIAGPEGGVGRTALERLVVEGRNTDWQRSGLARLHATREGPAGTASLLGLLDTVIASPTHPVRVDALLVRARIRAERGQLADAEADATAALEGARGTLLERDALAVLAAVSWQQRRFLTAAGWLTRLRDAAVSREDRSRLNALLADAFFAAGDFGSAAAAYAAVQVDPPPGVEPGPVLFQRAESELRAGRVEAALAALDEPAAALVPGVERWNAEWNALRALRGAGRPDDARARVERFAEAGATDALDPRLRVRFLWLRARLALETGDAAGSLRHVDALEAYLDSLAPGSLSDALASEVRSTSALLRAEALLGAGQADLARDRLAEVRTRFAGTRAAAYSYLVESRERAAAGELAAAELLLNDLVGGYPQSEFAAPALFEAALLAEQRGTPVSMADAIARLERLIREYGASPLVFAARMRQGDVARRQGRFEAAQQVYEAAIASSTGADRLLAQVALAETLLAQGDDPARFDTATSLLERVLDVPDAADELRIEAGYKLASAFLSRGVEDRARAVFAGLLAPYLAGERDPAGLGATGRYWLARCLLDHAQSAERAGDPRLARTAYRLHEASGLPGGSIARARLARLAEPSP